MTENAAHPHRPAKPFRTTVLPMYRKWSQTVAVADVEMYAVKPMSSAFRKFGSTGLRIRSISNGVGSIGRAKNLPEIIHDFE
jgi:hypothetical protein